MRFRDCQDVLGVLEGPRWGLRVLGTTPGRFWGLLGRPGRSVGGVQSLCLGGKYVTNTTVLELGRFSVTWGVWVLFVFYVCLSRIFVNRGGEFVVKRMKQECFEFWPVRNFQEKYNEHVDFGRWLMGFQHQSIHWNSKGISMIFIVGNVSLFDDIFNLSEFQEKQNIAY